MKHKISELARDLLEGQEVYLVSVSFTPWDSGKHYNYLSLDEAKTNQPVIVAVYSDSTYYQENFNGYRPAIAYTVECSRLDFSKFKADKLSRFNLCSPILNEEDMIDTLAKAGIELEVA